MKKTWMALLSVFMLALLLAACGGGNDDNANDTGNNDNNGAATEDNDGNGNVGNEAAADYDADAAAQTFQSNCSSCHGGNLEGVSGPALNKIGAERSQDEILDIILNGTQGGMPGGLIQGDEAENVAAWLADKK